jgi:hypothetical protein
MATATAGWALAQPAAGIELAVRSGDTVRPVEALAVTLTSLAVGLAAWVLLTVLEHLTRHARTVWTVVAAVVFLVSLTGPLAAVTPAATAALMSLHVVVAAILVVGLRRTAVPAGG